MEVGRRGAGCGRRGRRLGGAAGPAPPAEAVPPRPTLMAITLVLLGVLAAACGDAGADGPAERVTRRDSAGVEIVESHAPAWGESERWTVDPEPLVDLTATGDGREHQFFRVVGGTRLSDGTIVVADDGDDELRLFSPEGEHLRTLGGPGEGPGEFIRLGRVTALPGDSILAYETWPPKLTVFGPDGGVARIARVEGISRPGALFPLEGGGAVTISADIRGFRQEGNGQARLPNPIVRVGDEGRVEDTVATIPGMDLVAFGGRTGPLLWGRDGHLAVAGDRLYTGSATGVEYDVRTSDGRILRRVRAHTGDLGLDDEEIRAERETLTPDPEAVRPEIRALLDAMPDPDERPGYQRVLVDATGHVWLERYRARHERADPRDWLVFAPSGEWLGILTLPPRFQAFRIGPDWILGARRDDLDVQRVELLRLRRGVGPDA